MLCIQANKGKTSTNPWPQDLQSSALANQPGTWVSLYQHGIWIGQYVVARIWSWVTFCEFTVSVNATRMNWLYLWLSECNEYLKWAVFVLSQLTSTDPVNKSRVSSGFQMMCVVSQNYFEWNVLDCCLPITPTAFVMVFSSLSLSCFEAFPPQQTAKG